VRNAEKSWLKKLIVGCLVLIVLLAGLIGLLLYYGYIWPNNPSRSQYPVRGIDVSEHQGEVDWQAVKEAGFDFAFIKASEGMDYRDRYFSQNWQQSAAAGMIRSAYHFFTFKSPGLEQARNFIAAVPYEPDCLPPTIDVEFGGNSKEMPEKERLQAELNDFIQEVKNTYYKSPILYVTYDSYEKYIAGNFEDCVIWIRDLFHTAKLKDGRSWMFWQYNCRGRVDGIKGFVDLNVFRGDAAELRGLTSANSYALIYR